MVLHGTKDKEKVMTTRKCDECCEPATTEDNWLGQAFCDSCDRDNERAAELALSPVECCICGDVRRYEKMLWETASFLQLDDLAPTEECSICWDCWCKPLENLAGMRDDARKGGA